MNLNPETLRVHVVPNSAKEGFSRKNLDNKDSLEFGVTDKVYTLYDMFERAVREVPNDNYLGYRPYDPVNKTFLPYVFQTYDQVKKRADNFGSGIMKIAIEQAKTQGQDELKRVLDRNWAVGIYSINRMEWNITDRALSTQSLFSAGLYDTLGESSMEYILNNSEAFVVVCSLDKVHKILINIEKLPNLKAIVSMDSLETVNSGSTQQASYLPPPYNTKSVDILKQWASSKNVRLYDFETVEKIGSIDRIPHHPPKPNDTFTLLYTSGTTGNPKAAILTHENFSISAVYLSLLRKEKKKNRASMVSFLPLAHVYCRNHETLVLYEKGQIGYPCGDIAKVFDDTRVFKPSIFTGVPRLFSRLYSIFSEKTINGPGLLGIVSRKAVSDKINNLKNKKGVHHFFWDKILFNKTRAFVSENLEELKTSSAPTEDKVCDFLIVTLQTKIINVYGMTETIGAGISCSRDETDIEKSLIPFLGTEVRLRDVPEMKYLTTDTPNPRGEILMKSPSTFGGYFKDKEKTDETLVDTYWIATGDIGMINENGTISIIDRKKSLFKLSQGEYISPEKVENVLNTHPLILQSFVSGISTKSHLVAVIVPDPLTFIPWAKKIIESRRNDFDGMSAENCDVESLANNNIIKNLILEEIALLSQRFKLNGFEVVKAIHLEPIPFGVETNGLLTPTFKLKRFDAKSYYKEIIESLYQ
ncbi:hypothetical protein BB559_001510 [Furculomyces boomerangus]|uniref:AMP-dependent synthetase/ligase domain-containing protein n=1 Tax=Furculomyces boomerangus TaxID=61424 RepID=A0A2T9Z1S7_9FUNG|nr:hypothetical protein BB559_001510 [Furculomyces boomerangus]